MTFAVGFPARQPSGQTSIRVFISAPTAGGTFSATGNSFVFIDQAGANPYTPLPVVRAGDDVSRRGISNRTVVPPNPAGTGENYLQPDVSGPIVNAAGKGTGELTQPSIKAYIWSNSIIVRNTGGNSMDISFNGVDIHDTLVAGATAEYHGRREAGIAVKSGSGTTFEVVAW